MVRSFLEISVEIRAFSNSFHSFFASAARLRPRVREATGVSPSLIVEGPAPEVVCTTGCAMVSMQGMRWGDKASSPSNSSSVHEFSVRLGSLGLTLPTG